MNTKNKLFSKFRQVLLNGFPEKQNMNLIEKKSTHQSFKFVGHPFTGREPLLGTHPYSLREHGYFLPRSHLFKKKSIVFSASQLQRFPLKGPDLSSVIRSY